MGRLYSALVDRLARPLVRRIFDALPFTMRQRLARRQFRHGSR
jgi:hypothetical protein